jgi:hypothetical protein
MCSIALLFLATCCKQPQNETELFVDHFPESQPLTGVILKEFEIPVPKQLIVKDSLLVLLNSMGEHFFSVYDKSNLDLVAEFGKKGDGPLEFHAVDHIRGFTDRNEEQSHLILDWNNQRLNFLNLGESIHRNSPIHTSEKIPHNLSDTYRMVYYSDTLAIAVQGGHESAGRFKIVKDDSVKIVHYLPELPFTVHEDNLYRIYANVSSAIHPQKDKFVATTVLLGQYDFFDFDGNHLHSTVIDRDEILEKAAVAPIKADEPLTFYHTQLIGVDSLIYSLYSTVSREAEIIKSKIHVLDWEGKPVKEYIPDYPLIGFDLDLENDAIYGLSYSNDRDEKFYLVKFLLDEE